MNQLPLTLVITDSITLQEIVKKFEASSVDLILIDQYSVIAQPHMDLLSNYPRTVSTALVAKMENGNTLVRYNRVESASSKFHQVTFGNNYFLGAIRLSQKQRSEIISALSKADSQNISGNTADLTLVALVRATIEVAAAEVWAAPYIRTTNEAERDRVRKEIDLINPNKVRLLMANRSNDGFFSVFVLRRFSKLLTNLAVKIKATPNQVTMISLAIGLYSAYLFAQGSPWSLFAGALLLQVSIVVDCVDGELARYTRQFSKLGGWLDAVTDRVKEYMVLLGLAYGSWQMKNDLWIVATVIMIIQTIRHLSDYNFAQLQKIRSSETFKTSVDYTAKFDGIIRTENEPRVGVRYWFSKIIQFPIGERWLVISAASAIGGAVLTFTLMPILALISALFVIRGRFIVSRKILKNQIRSSLIINQLDLFSARKSFLIRFSWLEPSILRAIEFIVLLAIFIEKDLISTTTFIIFFSICFHHYDNLYRAMLESKKPKWLNRLGLYVEGRLLVIGLVAVTGWPLIWLAWYFGVLFIGIASIQWVIYLSANRVRQ